MAVGHGTLVTGSNSNSGLATNVDTASITTASDPWLAFIEMSAATTPPSVPTVTSTGMTWTRCDNGGTLGEAKCSLATARSIFVFKGVSTGGGTGAVNIARNSGDSGLSITGFNWTLIPLTGADVSTVTRYVGTVADTDWDLADTQTATMSGTPASDSAVYVGAMLSVTTDDLVQGASLTELDQHAMTTPSLQLHTSCDESAPGTSFTYTQTSGNNASGGVVAVEVLISAAVPVTVTIPEGQGEATAAAGATSLAATVMPAPAAADATAAGGGTAWLLSTVLQAIAADATADAGSTSLAGKLTVIQASAAASTADAGVPATYIASRITTPEILHTGHFGTTATSFSGSMSRAANTNEYIVMAMSYSRASPDLPTPPSTVTVSGVALTLFDDFVYSAGGTSFIAIAVYSGLAVSPTSSTTASASGFGYNCTGMEWTVFGWPGVGGIGLFDETVLENALSPAETDTLTLVGSPTSITSRSAAVIGMKASAADVGFPEGTWTELSQQTGTSPSQTLATAWSDGDFDASTTFSNLSATNTWIAGGIMFELIEAAPSVTLVILNGADATAAASAPALQETLVALAADAAADSGVHVPVLSIPSIVAEATADGIAAALALTMQAVAAEAFADGIPVLFPIVYTPVGRLGLGSVGVDGSSVMGNVVLGEPGIEVSFPIELEGIVGEALADAGVPVINLTVASVVADAAADAGQASPQILAAAQAAADAIADAGISTPFVLIESAVAAATADGLAVVILGIDRALRVSFADFRIADEPPALKIAWAEFETADGPNRTVIYYADMETIPNGIKLYWAELEAPSFITGERSAVIYWAGMRVPSKRGHDRDDSPVDRWHRSDVHHW